MTGDEITNALSRHTIVGPIITEGFKGAKTLRISFDHSAIKQPPLANKLCPTCLEIGIEEYTRREQWTSIKPDGTSVQKCVYRCIARRTKTCKRKNCVPRIYIVMEDGEEVLESDLI